MNINEESQKKLAALNNDFVEEVVEMAADLCQPDEVTIITDSEEDVEYIRELALKTGEEKPLDMEGHTYHFDGFNDQARDKENTKYLLTGDEDFDLDINSTEREKGLEEILSYLEGSMKGKEMLVRFFSLGPSDSPFTLPALQITDSSYVAHSEDILYRPGYQEFKDLDGKEDFFYFIHSAGELDANGNSKNIDKRRIYIDLQEDRVFSVNNQYAGNSVGLKKLAFRLAIKKASNEGWLAEHMFVSAVNGPEDRKTYFTGAFPSACGKTSTAMIPGNTVVGDDIAYLKIIDDEVRAVNVEKGIFGIIRDVNPDDDPIIYKVLTSPRELIFSNILVKDGQPYWMGMGQELPEEGINYSGKWHQGKTDENGEEITPSHKNARYTIRISDLDNCDENYNAPEGVPVEGVVYGGRDSNISVPVAETLDWNHGVLVGACLESETTSATLGKAGERRHNPMANLDFLALPIGKYIQNHLDFGEKSGLTPSIFGVNYFLKDEETGDYLNAILDKKVWMQWMDRRIHGEMEAIETPIGYIPHYEDLKELFVEYMDKDYTKEEYEEQFAIRLDNYIAKFDRMQDIYDDLTVPEEFTAELDKQIARLKEAKEEYGSAVVSPLEFA
ncbi:MAG: phosphoenolpyruvate carboxykinase (GTP) [Halanaerobiaceae bacterium]